MAIEQIERERSDDLSQVKSDTAIAPAALGAQTVDLSSLNAEMTNKWHVDESNRLTIQARKDSGTWDTAEVQVLGSIDNVTWTVLKTLTKIGFTKDIDVTEYTFVQIRVSVVEGGAGVGRFYGYGKVVSPPFFVPDRSAFGEQSVAEFTPAVQLQFPYSINPDVVHAHANQSGSVDVNSNMARLQTGAAANSSGEIVSVNTVKYNPGQGGLCRFTAVFTAGVANSTQIAGIGDTGDGYFFGYNGATFGIRSRKGGVPEVRTLTITTKSTTAEDVTITLDGDAKSNVAVTDASSGDLTTTANDIAAADYSDVGRGWDSFAVGDTVIFVSWCAGARTGTYSLTSATTAVGTFAQTLVGADDTETIVAQASWNVDPADGSGDLPSIDFTKGNVFQIKYQWLGFGAIEFFIEHPEDSGFHLVHRIQFANANTSPSVDNPTLPLYAGALNVSNTSNLTLNIGSMVGGTEGKILVTGPRHGTRATAATFSSGAETPVLTIRNKVVYQGVINRVHTILGLLGLSQDSTKTATVILTRNAKLTAASFSDVDTHSPIEVDSSATGISGGNILGTQGIAKEDKTDFPRPDPRERLAPGDTVTISIIPNAANPDVTAQFNYIDDF